MTNGHHSAGGLTKRLCVGALLVAAAAVLSGGFALSGGSVSTAGAAILGPNPDPPPVPPPPPAPPAPVPPPPQVYVPPPPPPPPAYVPPPPPPPAPVAPKRKPKPAIAPRPKKQTVAQPKPRATNVAALSSGPVAATDEGSTWPARLLALVGALLALLALGIALVPLWAIPPAIGMRLEHNRMTIALGGLAIGFACAVGELLKVLSGG
jgi:hypothetical protein